MRKTVPGEYIHHESREKHKVIKVTAGYTRKPAKSQGTEHKGVFDYKTTRDLHLKPLKDDLSVFKVVEYKDYLIHRID